MRPLISHLLAAGLMLAAGTASAADITGAGATFPYPAYAKWAEAYRQGTGIGLNYQSIGSGGGIKQIKAGTVDFGASDMPLPPDELQSAGLVQFPTLIGGVVPVVNVKGIAAGQLKLDGKTLAAIYLGRIAKWNDPAIAALNEGTSLPDEAISVVHRADGSGTTYIFTDYLAKADPGWKDEVGVGTAVEWPAGVGGKGNEGVANYARQIEGGIGYVEYAYALQNKLAFVTMKNADGAFVQPSAESFAAAASGADWKATPGFRLILTDQKGAKSWPITGATFILMQAKQRDPERGKQVLSFFRWAYDKGDQAAAALDYVPLPDDVVALVEASWKDNVNSANGEPLALAQ
jgi:phosphate transport system substrate-binding protein